MAGAKCFAVAPLKGEEYHRVCDNIGGKFIKFTTDGEIYVNIFDIRIPKESSNVEQSYLAKKLIIVSAYFEILMPYLTPLQ